MLSFRWQITAVDDGNIMIEGFVERYAGKKGEKKNWMTINRGSIHTLCDCLTETKVFKQSMPASISTEWDTFSFAFSASRERPDISIHCDHRLQDNTVEGGILNIPLDTFGDKKKNMTYIAPFIADLKTYIKK